LDFFAFFVAFEAKTASSKLPQPQHVEEAKKVLSVGFEHVEETTGIMLFRKPKRFSPV